MSGYFKELVESAGRAWNRFWYTPADPLPLCVLRLLTGLVALYYVFSFSTDLIRWFGPEGILNVDTTNRLTGADRMPYIFHYSYLALADTPAALWTLHALGLLILLAFTVGWWTRISSIAALVVVLSYVHRAPMLTGQLEPVLTMVIAYLCLVPAGRYVSIDAWLARRRARKEVGDQPAASGVSLAANLGLRLIQLHLVGFYLLIGLTMLAGDTWWAGEAVWWLIARSESRLIDFTELAHAMLLVNLLTHFIVAYQLLFAVLIWKRVARPLLLATGLFVWTFLALVTGLVAWSVMMLICGLVFVEPAWLRNLLGLVDRADGQQVA